MRRGIEFKESTLGTCSVAVEMDLRVGFVGVVQAGSLDGLPAGVEPLTAPYAALPADPPPQAG